MIVHFNVVIVNALDFFAIDTEMRWI